MLSGMSADSDYIKIHESEYGSSPENFHISKSGDQLNIELTYPPRDDAANKNDQVRHIYVNQESVRASDGIRMHYDYERDGWVIEQGSKWEWEEGEAHDEDWQEVAFVESWARDPRPAD
jgi:hypothetical protein